MHFFKQLFFVVVITPRNKLTWRATELWKSILPLLISPVFASWLILSFFSHHETVLLSENDDQSQYKMEFSNQRFIVVSFFFLSMLLFVQTNIFETQGLIFKSEQINLALCQKIIIMKNEQIFRIKYLCSYLVPITWNRLIDLKKTR